MNIHLITRHLFTQKTSTTLNLFGLALGAACLLLATIFWLDERGFDRFHSKKDQVFRITMSMKGGADEPNKIGGGTRQAHAAPFAAAAPEVKKWVRLLGGDVRGDVRAGENVVNLQMLFSDEPFFEIFDFPLVAGDGSAALRDLNSCVLTEKAALALFGTTDVVGRFLHQDNDPSAEKLGDKPMLIAAVAKNPPPNSSIQFEMLMPMRYLQLSFLDEAWVGGYLGTYVLLDEKTDRAALSAKFDRVFAEKAAPELAKMDYDPQVRFGLQPLGDIHLNAYLDGNGFHEGGTVGESKSVYSNLFLLVALFVFFMASINFINITLAASLSRAKEVAVRKMNGGSRWAIFRMFLGESALVCALAFCLAAVLASAVLPAFETLIERKISLAADARTAVGLVAVFFAIVAFSATYPAFLMSGFRPIETLSSRSKPLALSYLGRILVVGQFGLAIALVMGAIVFWEQLRFIEKKDLGYAPTHVIKSNMNGDVDYASISTALKNEIARHDCFEKIAFAGDFTSWAEGTETVVNGQKLMAAYQCTDENFAETMGIGLVSGQRLSPGVAPEILVNETFVQQASLENPIGTLVQIDPNSEEKRPPHRIVGVLRDFHFESLRKPVKPLVVWQQPWYHGSIYLKVKPTERQKAIEIFEGIYKRTMPTSSFKWHFVDELVARDYARERRFQTIIGSAALLALVICGLGMFGLAHFSALRRTKEIGIRKVLGASVAGITGLLAKDFLKLVVIAIVIASPIAYYFMNQWLADFTYRIEIQGWMFAVAGGLAVGIAFLTVGVQSVRAALVNPVRSLRSE